MRDYVEWQDVPPKCEWGEVRLMNAMEWGILLVACCILSMAASVREDALSPGAGVSVGAEADQALTQSLADEQGSGDRYLPAWKTLEQLRTSVPRCDHSSGVFSATECRAVGCSCLGETQIGGTPFFSPVEGFTRTDRVLDRQGDPSAIVTTAPEQVVRLIVCEDDDSIAPQYGYHDRASSLEHAESPAEAVALEILESVQSGVGLPKMIVLYYDSSVASEGTVLPPQADVQTESIPFLP